MFNKIIGWWAEMICWDGEVVKKSKWYQKMIVIVLDLLVVVLFILLL